MKSKIPGAQVNAWVLTAAVGPILSVVGHNSWMTVLVSAVAAGALSFCVLSCKQIQTPRWLSVVEIIWIAVFLGNIGKTVSTCWNETAFPAIPMILLLLSVCASSCGSVPAARVGATLLWLVMPILGLVAIAGTADVNPDWIRMELEIPDGVLISLLLIPGVCAFLPGESTTGLRWSGAVLGAFAVLGAVLVDGVVGGSAAMQSENSFYMFSKSINLFGVAERFEALIACVLTGSGFALMALLLSAVYHLSENFVPSGGKCGVWLTAAAGGILMCILPNAQGWLAVGTLIFWGFLPVAAQGIVGAKNMQKK